MCHALLLALTLLHPLAANGAQPLTGKITGTAVLGDIPLPGVTVTVTYGGASRTIVTDIDGHFAFSGIPLGAVVQLVADMESCKPQTRTAALTSAAASRDFTIAMKLQEGEPMLTVACAAPGPLTEPLTDHVAQDELDRLPVGRSLDNLLDLLPGTH